MSPDSRRFPGKVIIAGAGLSGQFGRLSRNDNAYFQVRYEF